MQSLRLASCFTVALTTAFSCFAASLDSAAWKPFSPRDEIAPECVTDTKVGRSEKGSLKVSTGKNAGAFGGWQAKVADIQGGNTYRFTAWYRAKNVPHERRSIIARLEWLDVKDKSVRPPDYALDQQKDGA